MKYENFRERVRKLPYFRSNLLAHLDKDPKKLEVQLSHWVKKGYVIKLRRGLYTLSESQRSRDISLMQIANNIYSPSYVSLHYALQFYNFIPEKVYAITSISPNKTAEFENKLGRFSYHSIKQDAFCGYKQLEDNYGNKFLIAKAEKALLDFLYFQTKHIPKVKKNIFDLSFRFQNLEEVSCEELINLAKRFNQKKLMNTAELLVEYIQEEWQDD